MVILTILVVLALPKENLDLPKEVSRPSKTSAISLPNARQRENSKQRAKSIVTGNISPDSRRDFAISRNTKPIGNLCSPSVRVVSARERSTRACTTRGERREREGERKKREKAATTGNGHNRCSINSVVGGLLWEPQQ